MMISTNEIFILRFPDRYNKLLEKYEFYLSKISQLFMNQTITRIKMIQIFA